MRFEYSKLEDFLSLPPERRKKIYSQLFARIEETFNGEEALDVRMWASSLAYQFESFRDYELLTRMIADGEKLWKTFDDGAEFLEDITPGPVREFLERQREIKNLIAGLKTRFQHRGNIEVLSSDASEEQGLHKEIPSSFETLPEPLEDDLEMLNSVLDGKSSHEAANDVSKDASVPQLVSESRKTLAQLKSLPLEVNEEVRKISELRAFLGQIFLDIPIEIRQKHVK